MRSGPQTQRTSTFFIEPWIGLEDWKRLVPYRTIDASFEAEMEATPESVRNYMRDNYFAGDWEPEYEPLVDIQAGWLRGPDWRRMACGVRWRSSWRLEVPSDDSGPS